MCINSLVFQLVSWTTQHKPSKENTTCVLTASAWWKAGILGRIISQKEELTWCDQEFGALPENELVTPNSRVHTEFPFFAKTPQMLRKSNHSQHRSSADKSSGCNNNQMTGKREGLSQRLAMRGWGGPSLSPTETWLDFRGQLVHPSVFSQGVLGQKTYIFFKSSWEGSSSLPTAFAFNQLFLISNWNLQSEFFMSWAPLLEDGRFHVNMLQIETYHNTQTSPSGHLWGGNWYWRKGGGQGEYWLYL